VTADRFQQAADLIDGDDGDDELFDVAAGAIADIPPQERAADDCVNAIIAAYRVAAATSGD
jgi:hypothetical protein